MTPEGAFLPTANPACRSADVQGMAFPATRRPLEGTALGAVRGSEPVVRDALAPRKGFG